jgi:hypothetical protein
MRYAPSFKKELLAVGIVAICLGMCLLCLQTLSGARCLLPYNTAWDQIHVGDTRSDVDRKCPDKQNASFNERGDNYYDERFYGYWKMYIEYDASSKVCAKRFWLYIGKRYPSRLYKVFTYGADA